jgi:hypothetical protein
MAQTIFGRWRSEHVFFFVFFSISTISPFFFLFQQVTNPLSSHCSVGHKPSMQTKEINQKIK